MKMQAETDTPIQGHSPRYEVRIKHVLVRVIKYFLEGIVVALAAMTLPEKPMDWTEITQVASIAVATFAILDFFSPTISHAARWGAGAGIGAKLVGFKPMTRLEPFEPQDEAA